MRKLIKQTSNAKIFENTKLGNYVVVDNEGEEFTHAKLELAEAQVDAIEAVERILFIDNMELFTFDINPETGDWHVFSWYPENITLAFSFGKTKKDKEQAEDLCKKLERDVKAELKDKPQWTVERLKQLRKLKKTSNGY